MPSGSRRRDHDIEHPHVSPCCVGLGCHRLRNNSLGRDTDSGIAQQMGCSLSQMQPHYKRNWAAASISSIPACPLGLHALGLSVRSGGACMAKVPFRRYMEFDFRNEHPHGCLLGLACLDCASLHAHTVVDGPCADTIRIAIPRHRVRGVDAVRDVWHSRGKANPP
jgi:hypothetical protein